MHAQGFFMQALVYLAAAVISVPIAKRLGLGSVLGYLLAGMALGPFCLRLIGAEGADVMHFAEFGVVMMLFLIGLELEPRLLWRLRRPILGLGGLQVGVTATLLMAIALALGLRWQPALATGLILALSSTAIVLQILSEKRLTKTDAGQTSFSVLLFQDLAVIPMFALLPLLAAPQLGAATALGHDAMEGATAGLWIKTLPGWQQAAIMLLAVGGIILLGRFLARPILRVIAQTRLRELFTAAALLLVLGIALAMEQVGLSPALGAFLGGVVLANSEYRHELEGDIEPFKGLLLAVFFISVGASIDFQLIAAQPGLLAATVLILLVVKFVVLLVLGRVFGMGLDQNLLFSFALSQGGEFAFVLIAFATQRHVLPAEVTGPLVATVAVSMALTPLLMLLNEKVIQPHTGTRRATQREEDKVDERNAVIIAGFGRFGSVVGRLLRANGIQVTVLEFDSDQVDILRQLGLPVFYGDASRHDLLRQAGAEEARLLVLAIDDHEKIKQLVGSVREHFPHLTLFARAAGRDEAYELVELGVEHIYRETLDTSLRAGTDALRLLGVHPHEALRAARTFRRHDEDSVHALARVRRDDTEYFREARRRIRDLEDVLLNEIRDAAAWRDLGWDTESLRSEYGDGAAPAALERS